MIRATFGAMVTVPVAYLAADYKLLLQSLTVANPEYKNAQFFGKGYIKKSISKHIFCFAVHEKEKAISVPRNMEAKYFKAGIPWVSEVSMGEAIAMDPKENFELREEQKEYFDSKVFPYMDKCRREKRSIDMLLNAPCGTGKTVMSMFLTAQYGVNTLVAVTKRGLGKQFIETVKEFFPDTTVGWFEEGKPLYNITIATYALLGQDKFDAAFYSQFGHIVLDEFHRVGAEYYNKVIQRAGCKYRTSLTATFRRKDGLEKILKHHCGEVLTMDYKLAEATIYPVITGTSLDEEALRPTEQYYASLANTAEYTDIAVFAKRIEIDRGCLISKTGTGEFRLKSIRTYDDVIYNTNNTGIEIKKLGASVSSVLDNEIILQSERNDIILSIIKQSRTEGRTILLLCKRKAFLFTMGRRLARYGYKVGIIISAAEKDYKEYVKALGWASVAEYQKWCFEHADVMCGIDKLAEEGLDVPRVDTLIYVHPVSDVEQSIGRILRKHPGKKDPRAYYLIDKVQQYRNMFYNPKKGAQAMFLKLGHTVMHESTIDTLYNYA